MPNFRTAVHSEPIVLAREAGQLESGGARAVVTALIVEDPTALRTQHRGIRVEITHKKGKHDVYVAESGLPLLKRLLDGLQRTMYDVVYVLGAAHSRWSRALALANVR